MTVLGIAGEPDGAGDCAPGFDEPLAVAPGGDAVTPGAGLPADDGDGDGGDDGGGGELVGLELGAAARATSRVLMRCGEADRALPGEALAAGTTELGDGLGDGGGVPNWSATAKPSRGGSGIVAISAVTKTAPSRARSRDCVVAPPGPAG